MTSETSVYPAPLSAERERRSFALGFFFVFLLSVLIGALLFLLFPLAFSDLLLEKIAGHFSYAFSDFPGFLAEVFRRSLPDIRQLLLLLLVGFSYLSGFFVRLLFLFRGLSFGLSAVPVLRMALSGAVRRPHAAAFLLSFLFAAGALAFFASLADRLSRGVLAVSEGSRISIPRRDFFRLLTALPLLLGALCVIHALELLAYIF